MAQTAPWANDPVVTDRPAAQPAPSARLVQIAPPQPSQAPGQTAEQAEHQRLENIRLQQQIDQDNLRNGGGAASTDPNVVAQARALAEGRIPWPSGRAATDPHWQQIINTAVQIDPNIDETTHARRRAAVTQFTGNGSAAQRVGSAERLARHLNDLSGASDRLAGPDLGMGWANSVAATVGQSFEPTDARTYDTAVNSVANELERFFRGSGGSESDIHRMIENMGRNQSADSRRAAIREVVNLIGGGIEPLQQQYNDAFTPGSPRPHITWLSPRAREIYSRLGGMDLGIEPGGNPQAAVSASGAPSTPPPVDPDQANATRPHAVDGAGNPVTASDIPHPEGDLVLSGRTDTHIPISREQTAAYINGVRQFQPGTLTVADYSRIFQDTTGRPATGDPRQMQAIVDHYNRTGEVSTNFQYRNPGDPTPDQITAAVAQQRGADANGGAMAVNDAMGSAAPVVGPLINAVRGYNQDTGRALQTGFQSGATAGFDTTAQSAGAAMLGDGSYDQNMAMHDAISDYDAQNHPIAHYGGQLLGAAATAPLMGGGGEVAEGAGMGARMLAGGRTGGAVGALNGVGNGRGAQGRAVGGIEGAVGGAALGAAAPVVGAVGRSIGRAARGAFRTVLGEDPDLSRQIISRAITADGNTPASAGGQMADAQAHGVPAMLADTGDNVRGLLAASARAPGPARTAARTAVDTRQEGLAERVTGAVERDLGPVANPHEVADNLMTQARDTAAPLYDAAYARPGADAFVQRVAPLLSRPSMQRALQRAERIASEEGRDPNTAGFEVNSSGEVTISPTPSWQTLDYIKRGMDDVIEGYRDSTTGKLNLDTEGRAVNNTLRSFLGAFDQANPDYAAARAAYAGPVRGIDAMNTGRRFLSMTADDMEARMRGMSPYERQMAQLGARRAMAELVATKGDTANVVNALVGTGKKRAMLARLFGDRASFNRFVATLGHEQEAYRTYSTARLGSPTAANLQDDNALRDAGTEAATDLVLNGGTGILPSALKFVARLGRRRMDEQTANHVTALLSESDPARLREFANELRQEQTRQAVARARQGRNARIGGAVAGETVGGRNRN